MVFHWYLLKSGGPEDRATLWAVSLAGQPETGEFFFMKKILQD